MKVLIYGYYGFKNFGDELILCKIIEDIKSIDSKAEIAVCSGDISYTQKIHGVIGVDRFSPDVLCGAVKDSDIVIVGGGGLIQEYYNIELTDFFKSFGYGIAAYSSIPLISKILQKPVFYWSHGIGPIFTEEGRNFTKWFYSLADFTTLRDSDSYNTLKTIYPEVKNVYIDTDPVMCLDINRFIKPISVELPNAKIKIGINIRPWFDIEGTIEKLSGAIKELSKENMSFVIVPIPFDSSLDKEPLKKFISSLPAESVFEYGFEEMDTPEKVISLMNELDCFVGMRLHSIMISRLLKIPTLSISYDLKTDKFSDILKIPAIRVQELTKDNMLAQIRSLLNINKKNLKNVECQYKTPELFKDFIEGENLSSITEVEVKMDKLERVIDISKNELLIYENYLKSLRAELNQRITEKNNIQNQLNQTIAEKDNIQNQLNQTIAEKDNIQNQLNQTIAEKDNIQNQLNQTIAEKDNIWNQLNGIYSSDFWKIASLYYRVRDTNPLINAVYRILKRYKHLIVKHRQLSNKIAVLEQKNYFDNLGNFTSKNRGKSIYIIYAAVRFTEMEGQRSVRLSQSLIGLGNAVIFIYWNWTEHDKDVYGEVTDGLFAMPKDDFLNNHKEILKLLYFSGAKNTLFIEFPDPNIIPVLLEANSLNFVTVYDILDDWKEFNKVGQAVWYDRESELFILRNTTYRFAVTNSLIEKFQHHEIHLVPNGFDPEKLKDKPCLEVEKGETTIGYFGHLTEAWFDWNLLIETANNNNSFMFHIIGYGMPNGLNLPKNIKYIGKIQPSDISSYVKNWDVCIIPFKDGNLSKSVDPIKLYEYLYFKKPVVVTGLSHLAGHPYVIHSQSNSELLREAILEAKKIKIEDVVIDNFLKDKTWIARAESMLKFVSRV